MGAYRVVWEIDVDADSPRDAAIKAMNMQGAHTTANVFDVRGPIDMPKGVSLLERYESYPPIPSVEIDFGDEPRHLLPEYEAEEDDNA